MGEYRVTTHKGQALFIECLDQESANQRLQSLAVHSVKRAEIEFADGVKVLFEDLDHAEG